jgi:hypothetical protein
MYYAADKTAIIHPIDAPDIRRQMSFDPLPLLLAPRHVSAHEPKSHSKPNQDQIVDPEKLEQMKSPCHLTADNG